MYYSCKRFPTTSKLQIPPIFPFVRFPSPLFCESDFLMMKFYNALNGKSWRKCSLFQFLKLKAAQRSIYFYIFRFFFVKVSYKKKQKAAKKKTFPKSWWLYLKILSKNNKDFRSKRHQLSNILPSTLIWIMNFLINNILLDCCIQTIISFFL